MNICEILSLLIIFRFYNCILLKNLEQIKCSIDNDDDNVDNYNCYYIFKKHTYYIHMHVYTEKKMEKNYKLRQSIDI